MTGAEAFSFVARATSVFASVVGIVILAYIAKVLKHLVGGQFRKIFLLLWIFFLAVIIGVVSMTFYHFFHGEEIEEVAELLWYAFMFISIPISCYAAYKSILFGKSIIKIKESVLKKKDKKRR